MRQRKSDILLPVCLIVLACVIIFALGGCRSSRGTTASQPTYGSNQPELTPITSQDEPSVTPAVQLTELIDSYQPWTDLTMSVKCRIRSPKSLSISGKAYMVRGQEIRISLRMLGFEVGGLYADNDSLCFYEKLNRTMVVESMSRITAASGLTLSDIQDILLGHLTYPGTEGREATTLLRRFDIDSSADAITLSPRKAAIPWAYRLSRRPSAALMSIDLQLPDKGSARCTYAAPLLTPAGPVSPTTDVSATFGKNTLDASLNWSLENASWNQGLMPSGDLPSGYRRIPLVQLLKSLGSTAQ